MLVTVRSLGSFFRTFSYSEMAFCSLPCWTYFSALAENLLFIEAEQCHKSANSRAWSSIQSSITIRERLGNLLPVLPQGHPHYRQMDRPGQGQLYVWKS